MSFIEEMADEVVFLLEGNIFFNGTIDSLMKQTKARNLELAISTIIQNSND